MTALAPNWEEILVKLIETGTAAKVYPLLAPLEADQVKGHVVYTPISDDVYSSYEGNFVDSVRVSLDVRAESYAVARSLLRQCVNALKLKGKGGSTFLWDRDVITTEYDTVTDIYRFILYLDINPYYVLLDTLKDRAFSRSFSRSYG